MTADVSGDLLAKSPETASPLSTYRMGMQGYSEVEVDSAMIVATAIGVYGNTALGF